MEDNVSDNSHNSNSDDNTSNDAVGDDSTPDDMIISYLQIELEDVERKFNEDQI